VQQHDRLRIKGPVERQQRFLAAKEADVGRMRQAAVERTAGRLL
jgi:hypothetical protein